MVHSLASDLSVLEFWGALGYGGRLVVIPSEISQVSQARLAFLARERITILVQTRSEFHALTEADAAIDPLRRLRYASLFSAANDLG